MAGPCKESVSGNHKPDFLPTENEFFGDKRAVPPELLSAEEVAAACHEYGGGCDRCGGLGVRSEADAAANPGCPLSPEFVFEPGPAAYQVCSAKEGRLAKERANQIAPLRKSVRMSQKMLAEQSGVSRSLIAMMESGRAACSAQTFEVLKRAARPSP